eukprot:CAMPEP_0170375476 /NCGR_PEP_ID=MMETSP0117_2-20130122/11179_1 /TAXON_ID=400756 /ORGANISM="Durinskia baltica, Strain CSIRO CS-38" /LENGTH=37 /DNA_ID= /DNA_START= /DNA_END= /DNA_ORIENTATION=
MAIGCMSWASPVEATPPRWSAGSGTMSSRWRSAAIPT